MLSMPSFSSGSQMPVAAAGLSPRVRASLESYSKGLSTELAAPAEALLWALEAQLQRAADTARGSAGQAEALQRIADFRQRRGQWLPRLLGVIEAELADIRKPVSAPASLPASLEYQHLSLVDHEEMEQEVVLGDVLRRLEHQHATDLHLLGQRFGVLACAPAFGFERIPAGPQSLLRALRQSTDVLELSPEWQLQLYRLFEPVMLREYAHCLQLLNELLSSHGVLPGLVFRPYRGRIERAARHAAAIAARQPVASAAAPAAIASDGTIAVPQAPAVDPAVLRAWFDDLPLDGDDTGARQLHALMENLARTDAPRFAQAQGEVEDALRQSARKAELAERRHIQSAQGRDRLEAAKLHASEQIEAALELREPSKFVQTLLRQAWADVLALARLRFGEDSAQWHDVALLTDVLAAGGNPADAGLAPRVLRALLQVGYHADEASEIARHLSGVSTDALARTRLLVKLRYRARLGETDAAARSHATLDATAQRCRQRLGTLPFGTWLELDGDGTHTPRRLRLSWHSASTGQALLVDAQGQRSGEHDLDELAHGMAQDRVRIAARQDTPLLDGAWTQVLARLRMPPGAPS